MYVYMNGELVPKDQATVSAFDHGFLYGVGLFETFRIYNGHAFLLEDHLQRLNKGLSDLSIKKNFSKQEVMAALSLLLEKNGYENAYIRFNVSAGYGEVGLQVEPYEVPNVIIYPKPLPPAGNDIFEKKAQLLTIKRNTPEGSYRLKSHHFLNNIYAKREIGNFPDVEGIFLTENDELAEGIVSNLFWFNEGTLFTPAVETGILNGITRQFVIKLAAKLGYQVKEGFFKPEVLETADEIFITNSIQEIVGIKEWNGRYFPGKQGKITQLLFQQYRQYCLLLSSKTELDKEV
ncbi:aminodeoxychorismate lyase [Neobacillus sp. D3-1R]|uniref:aminodeoxychorismate lyase n=1 Tax=Neobacillus sp. D3-1R TaxID=3445778 RepID=UPI003FA07F43